MNGTQQQFTGNANKTKDELAEAINTCTYIAEHGSASFLNHMSTDHEGTCKKIELLLNSTTPSHPEIIANILSHTRNLWNMERELDLKDEIVTWINKLSSANKAIVFEDGENYSIIKDAVSSTIRDEWKTEVAKWKEQVEIAADLFQDLLTSGTSAISQYLKTNTEKACQLLDTLSQSNKLEHQEIMANIMTDTDLLWDISDLNRHEELIRWFNPIAPKDKAIKGSAMGTIETINSLKLGSIGEGNIARWKKEIANWGVEKKQNVPVESSLDNH